MGIFLDPTAKRKTVIGTTCQPEGSPSQRLPYTGESQSSPTGPGCILLTPNGPVCPPTTDNSFCSPGQLQKQSADTCYINDLANENLNLGGADAHLYKLLGVKQQGTLIDAAGFGCPIASDQLDDYPACNAFNRFETYWSSDNSGVAVRDTWLGYDFGLEKRDNDLPLYSNEANAESRKHITTIAIKQGGGSNNWVKRVRVERSDDGKRWHGVDTVSLPATTDRVQVSIKQSVPARMWRLKPIELSGNGRWIVESLELFEFVPTALSNLQDSPLFQENRDRSYCINPVKMKIFYDLVDISTELSRFGIDLPSATLSLTVNFSQAVKQLGRGVIIGDVIEIPSEMQFTPDMKIVRKFVEVTDVRWSTKGYTPGWTPLFQQITAKPMLARQEVLDIIGSLEPDTDEGGDGYDSGKSIYSEMALHTNEQIQIAADAAVQQLGTDETTIADISEIPEHHIKIAEEKGINLGKLVGESSNSPTKKTKKKHEKSAMPPAGTSPEMFTTGDHSVGFPDQPRNGQYHRMTYDTLAVEKIPPKLYRYSLAKNRWIFLESDERYEIQSNKTRLKSYISSEHSIAIKDIE
jgi:hypothetical protein